MQTSKATSNPTEKPLWRLAFRGGFLLAALFAVLGMTRWLYWLWHPADWDYRIYPAWWHGHEMIFGFAMPVVAGFLLTAVANWTGIPGPRGRRLQVLFSLWALARLVLWLAPGLLVVAWLAEMLFLALLLWELSNRVWAVRQWRNMLFPPVLLALALLSSASFHAVNEVSRATQLHYGALWMVTLLVVIIGGRVTPLFTGNRLGIKISPLPDWFEYLAMGITAGIGVVMTLWPAQETATAITCLCVTGGIVHAIRLLHWRGWQARGVPLLWSMHLSYLCIPLAMCSLAMVAGDPGAVKHVMHLLAVGTIGGMILAMMSRVSLGHTGRSLEVPTYIAVAFALVFGAALLRAFLPLWDSTLVHWAWRISALLWTVAFAMFIIHYWPILTQPRADGKPG